jgi:hypothetical protein
MSKALKWFWLNSCNLLVQNFDFSALRLNRKVSEKLPVLPANIQNSPQFEICVLSANSNKGQCYIKEMNISKNTLTINDSERLHYAMILLHVDDAGKTKYKYYEHNRLD